MKFGKVAILTTLAAAALRCSGNPPVSEPGQAPLTAPSAVVIDGIDHTATPSGTTVVLHGNYPFSYTSYQPDPRTLVLELLDVHVQGVSDEVSIGTPQVGAIHVSSVESVDGGTIAKFEFKNVLSSQHAIRLDGNDLVVDFPTLGESGNAPEPPLVAQEVMSGEQAPGSEGEGGGAAPAGTADTTAPASAGNAPLEALPSSTPTAATVAAPAPDLQTVPSPAASSASTPAASGPAAPAGKTKPAVEPVRVKRGPVPSGTLGKALLAVEAQGADPEPAVLLKADGPIAQEHFELKNPPRLVIDLLGVLDRTTTKSIAVGSGFLSKVRVAQFATKPRPVARVVLDMSAPKPYAIVPTDNGLLVDFSEEAVRRAQEAEPASPAQTQRPLAAESPSAAPSAPAPASAGPPTQAPAAPAETSAAAPPQAAPETAAEAPAVEAAPKAPANPLLASGEAKVEASPREVAFKSAGSDSGNGVMISQGG